jgi:hypothetical protein
MGFAIIGLLNRGGLYFLPASVNFKNSESRRPEVIAVPFVHDPSQFDQNDANDPTADN